MAVDAWHLPWKNATVPHALVDIIRGCNITCDACYNTRPAAIKSLKEIAQDLDILMAHRRLDSVLLVGGEVLLHPRLAEVVRLVKARGLAVEIATNGLLLNDAVLSGLQESGVDLLFLHIDRGQRRPDLPANPTPAHLRALWEERTALVVRHGIDVGLTMTAFEERLSDVRDMVDFTLESATVNYLLVTLFRDSERIHACRGDLASGLKGKWGEPERPRRDTLTINQIQRYLWDERRLKPFCYLGSNRSADDPRWLSYLVATRNGRQEESARHCLKMSAFEKAYLAAAVRLSGRYPMYRRQNPRQLLAQLVLNGLAGGDCAGNLRFFAQSFLSPASVLAKRLLFQCPADIAEDGTVIHCSNCPDAVVRKGKLVPVCIADRMDELG
jgi:pyruvate-formate lyase-activating enzyme